MKATFNGDATTTYAEYIDTEHDRTLVAEPGKTYEIRQAAGVTRPSKVTKDNPAAEPVPVTLPMPPDGRWTPARTPAKTKGQD